MIGSPPSADRRITLDNWDWPPFNRWSFQNVRQILPTRVVERGGGPVHELPRADVDLSAIRFRDATDRDWTLLDALEATFTDGFLVLHDGRIAGELYFNGMTAKSQHLSQSVAKSVTSALMGAVFAEAGLDLQAPVTRYVPELAGCGYRDALLWHALDMRSGIKFSEDYLDRGSEVGGFERASLWKPQRPGEPASSYDFILTLDQARPHGGKFEYRSIETEILGWVLERTTGLGLAELLGSELWQRMGAEADGYFTVDRAGSCMASGGFNATLRDYGRFGQMMLDDGAINGRQVVPAQWVHDSRRGDQAAFADTAPHFAQFPSASYSRQWWVFDPDAGLIAALGIFGQMVLIDVTRRMVVVKLSSCRDPLNQERRLLTLAAIAAIGSELAGR
jgi:CubicO group peptidase (beta-lactamase class C family)